MSEENQHWVPKFVVKNFTDRDGRVFRLDIETDEVTKPPPRRAASDINFNEFVIDGKVISFEDSLTKIETPAAPIFRRIAAARSTASLTDSDRMRAAKFMAAQSFRTEAFYKGIEGHKARNDFGAVFKQLWESAFLVADDIARRHWILLSIEHDDVFNLGDHPLVLQNTENPSAGGPLGFDIQGVEAFLPLTPKCELICPAFQQARKSSRAMKTPFKFIGTCAPLCSQDRCCPA